jgi:hypothetical protein
MPSMTKHTVGRFSWPECATKDATGSRGFDPELLGCTFQDDPHPMGGTFMTFRKSDGRAGGRMPMPPWAAGRSRRPRSSPAGRRRSQPLRDVRDAATPPPCPSICFQRPSVARGGETRASSGASWAS